jgi:hypothetical protein
VEQGTATVTWTPAPVLSPTTLTTSLTGGGKTGATISVPAGTAVTDTDTLAGPTASTATGSVSYAVYSDSACTKLVQTAGSGGFGGGVPPSSSAVTLSTPGTYYWMSAYSGDGANAASTSACGSEVETVTAVTPISTSAKLTGAATLSGSTVAGDVLFCGPSGWTPGTPTYTYAWYRNGTELAGVTTATYTLVALDEGTTIYCVITGTDSAGTANATSNSLQIPIPKKATCPAATGKMTGSEIGDVHLGMSRSALEKLFAKYSPRGRKFEDFFCLTPIGIRVGYASTVLRETLNGHERTKINKLVVWASTSNPYYSIDGVRPGQSIASASKKLDTTAPFHIGKNYWYLARKSSYTVVLKVRHGTVEEIGVADNFLTTTRHDESVLMHSFY